MGFHFLASCKTLFPFKIGVHCSATQITETKIKIHLFIYPLMTDLLFVQPFVCLLLKLTFSITTLQGFQ